MKADTDLWKMVDELLEDESDRMTSWELYFLESLNKQDRGFLSPKQERTIIKIWDKVYG